jgi:hypothetical protein
MRETLSARMEESPRTVQGLNRDSEREDDQSEGRRKGLARTSRSGKTLWVGSGDRCGHGAQHVVPL